MQPRYAKWEDGHKRVNLWAEWGNRLRSTTPKQWLVMISYLGLAVACGSFAAYWHNPSSPELLLFFTIPALASVFKELRGIAGRTLPQAHEAPLMIPEPSPCEAFPVDIVLFDCRMPVGEDSGFIVFNDGWFVFEGARTTFSLRPSDVAYILLNDRQSSEQRMNLYVTRCPICLELRESYRSRNIGIWTRNSKSEIAQPSFVDTLKSWWRFRSEEEGVSMHPPSEPHPLVAYYAWRWFWLPFPRVIPVAAFLGFLASFAFGISTSLIVEVALFVPTVSGTVAALTYLKIIRRITGSRKNAEPHSLATHEETPIEQASTALRA